MEDNLPTHLFVDANLRRCQAANMPVYVMQKGDHSRGIVCLKLVGRDGQCRVFSQMRDMDGIMKWYDRLHGQKQDEREADQMLRAMGANDPDIWIVEVETGNNEEFPFDGKIIDPNSV